MKDITTISKSIAILSFGIGTILFAFQLYLDNDLLVSTGLVFILFATVINCICCVILLISLFVNFKHRFEALKTLGMVLLNIPIAFSYLYIILYHVDL
jgi:hypothetical protein